MFHGPYAPLYYAVAGASGLAVLVALGITVYALGSFALMLPHTKSRTLGLSLRELFREVWVASWTQPLLPLFYVFGRRMDGFLLRRAREGLAKEGDASRAASPASGPATPIVFVHGYMQNRVGFVGLARALGRRGVGPLYGFNYPWFSTLAKNAKRLHQFVSSVCAETGSHNVDLVCHSMGGLVAMEMMRDEAWKNDLKVRRCVTIATPHAGVMWKGPMLGFGATNMRKGSKLLEAHAGYKIAVPCLSLYSSHDNVVHPKESSQLGLRGGRDVEVENVAHLSILFSGKVADHVAEFLTAPDPL